MHHRAGIARLVAEAVSSAEVLAALQVDASSLEACLFILAHLGEAVGHVLQLLVAAANSAFGDSDLCVALRYAVLEAAMEAGDRSRASIHIYREAVD